MAAPATAFVPFVQTGKLLFLSGHSAKSATPALARVKLTFQYFRDRATHHGVRHS